MMAREACREAFSKRILKKTEILWLYAQIPEVQRLLEAILKSCRNNLWNWELQSKMP